MACHLPLAAAAASVAWPGVPEGCEALLLARCAPNPSGTGGASSSGSGGGAEFKACLLCLPPGWRVTAMSAYKKAQLALVLTRAGSGRSDGGAGAAGGGGAMDDSGADDDEGGGGGSGRGRGVVSQMALVGSSDLAWADTSAADLAAWPHVLQACLTQGAVSAWPGGCRARAPAGLAAAAWQPPLLVSAARGVAALVATGGRAAMYDLEEDEEVEEGGEEGDEEAEGDDEDVDM